MSYPHKGGLPQRRSLRRCLQRYWYFPSSAWFSVMLLEPTPDVWPEMLLGATTHHDPDMTSGENKILFVPAAHQVE